MVKTKTWNGVHKWRRVQSTSLLLVENISSAGACATSTLIAHAARTLHNKTWGRSIKTVQPCRAGWPSAAQHWGCLWAGSGCWELRVSRSCPLIDDTICGSLPVRALNFGWRETKASCVPVWSLCSTVPVGVVLVDGGAAGPGVTTGCTRRGLAVLWTWSVLAAEGSASAE